MLYNFMMAIFKEFWDLLFPRTCLSCQEEVLVQGEEGLCTHCRAKLPQTNYHLTPSSNLLYNQLASLFSVKYAFAYLLFTKNGRTQKLLHQLKYRQMPELGQELGRWYGRILAGESFQHQFDALIPVPLHPDKLKKRGYNQSSCFAMGMAQSMQLPVWDDVIKRSYASQTQTRKSRLQRWLNVETIFEASDPQQKIAGSRLLLVDDVITTGATIISCAQVLQKAGCSETSCASLATA